MQTNAAKRVRKRLEEVKRRITERPEEYDHDTACGTQCCIAGHLAVLDGGQQDGWMEERGI